MFRRYGITIKQDIETGRLIIKEGKQFRLMVDELAFRRAVDALMKGEFD